MRMIPALLAGMLLATGAAAQVPAKKPPTPASAPQVALADREAVPPALKAAMLDRYGDEFSFAAARIGNSDVYVVYAEGFGLCGSGGCRPKIWRKTGATFTFEKSLPVGFPPIYQLATSHNGMPDIGITTQFNAVQATFVMAIEYDGKAYSSAWTEKKGQAAGRILLIDEKSIKPVK